MLGFLVLRGCVALYWVDFFTTIKRAVFFSLLGLLLIHFANGNLTSISHGRGLPKGAFLLEPCLAGWLRSREKPYGHVRSIFERGGLQIEHTGI